MFRLKLISIILLLGSCAPAPLVNSETQDTQDQVQTQNTRGVEQTLDLSTSIKSVTVPETDTNVSVLSFLSERTSFESSSDKGTIERLGYSVAFEENEQNYLVLSVQVERILSGTGVYLILFKEFSGVFEQVGNVKIGQFVKLPDLSWKQNYLEVSTVTSDLGKSSEDIAGGGLFQYQIRDNLFVEIKNQG